MLLIAAAEEAAEEAEEEAEEEVITRYIGRVHADDYKKKKKKPEELCCIWSIWMINHSTAPTLPSSQGIQVFKPSTFNESITASVINRPAAFK